MANDKQETNNPNETVIVPETEVQTIPTKKGAVKGTKHKNSWLLVIIAILVLIGLGVGIYFLVKKPNTPTGGDATDEIEEIEELTDEERYEKIDSEIAESTKETYYPLVIEKANREIGLGMYDSALATLSTVAESELDLTLLHSYYSSYVSLFTAQGAEKETEEYQAKADAVYQRLIAEGIIQLPEEEPTEEAEGETEATE